MTTVTAPLTFHEGELAWQERAGSRARLAEAGPRVIRDYMPDQHREFFAQLPFLLAGTLDAQGQPWASVLAGPPGFVASPDPQQLVIRAHPLPHDPLAASLAAGTGGGAEVHHLSELDAPARALIARADTFFIATAHPLAGLSDSPAYGVDVSHRGGKPGFVRADADSRLTVPDFIGNFFFNTLGNLALDSRCGLLFMDFENGDLLYLAARGEVLSEGPELAGFLGAQRLLRLQVVSGLRVAGVLPLRWGPAELSPVLAGTGSW